MVRVSMSILLRLVDSVLVLRRLRNGALFPALVGCGLLISACSSSPDDTLEFDDTPPETLYSQAVGLMNTGAYTDAAKKFEEVDKNHPYSDWARQAIVMSAFNYFRAGAFDESQAAAERYLALHPGSDQAAYAQFLIAQSYFQQVGDIGRDQGEAQRALQAYSEITRLYPESEYAPAAQRRQDELLNHLAGKEMEIGRYYMGRQNFLSAVNRFRVVLSDYQTTHHVEEALLRLTEAYRALGVVSEAQTAAAVLGHNYPDSSWYQDAYRLLQADGLEPIEDRGSWISRTLGRVRL